MNVRDDDDSMSIEEMPVEILFKIFSYLSPEKNTTVALVSRKFDSVSRDNVFWMRKFERHFPHIFTKLSNHGKINWYDQFRKTYEDEYRGLTPDIRKLFSLVKENDNDGLKHCEIEFDILLKLDKKKVSLMEWALKKDNQLLLDDFYKIALKYYSGNTEWMIDPNKTDKYKRTILHWAVICRQSRDTIELLASVNGVGVNVNAASNTGAMALHLAAKKGHVDAAKVLLENGANVQAACTDGATPLHIAAQNGHLDVVNVLLENNANVDALSADRATPLYIAAQNGHFDIFNILLQNGANIEATLAYGSTPLYIAAQNGHLDIFNVLLAKGANIEATCADDATPLYAAAQNGHLDIFNILLQNGANIEATLAYGSTPLYIAAQNGHLDIFNVLLAKGANIEATCADDATPLYAAAQNGHLDIFNILLAKGANVEAARADGATPLHIAAQNGHLEVVKALLKKGANLEAARTNGAMALSIAQKKGHGAIVKVLENKKNIKNLYEKIHVLHEYGEKLEKSKIAKGAVVKTLATDLKNEADTYFGDQDNNDFDAFGKKFNELMHDQHDLITTHRNYGLTPILANIAIALTGIGLIAFCAKSIYLGVNGNLSCATLFYHPKTSSENKIEDIQVALNQAVPAA